MSWFWGLSSQLWEAAAKAALMYLVAVLALRATQRRTLAEWTAIDFAAPVAVPSIIGRTAFADRGELRRDQLRICGSTDGDVAAQLRQAGVRRLDELRYVLYETKAELTVVREDDPGGDLIDAGLRAATGSEEVSRK